jgi:hypothetical protein
MASCPVIRKEFQRLTNMSAAEIRSWAKDDRAKCFSQKATRRRLTQPSIYRGHRVPSLANLRKRAFTGAWSEEDCWYGNIVNGFNKRFLKMKQKHGCTDGIVVALRNWGHQPKSCAVPTKKCKREHEPRVSKKG